MDDGSFWKEMAKIMETSRRYTEDKIYSLSIKISTGCLMIVLFTVIDTGFVDWSCFTALFFSAFIILGGFVFSGFLLRRIAQFSEVVFRMGALPYLWG